MKISNYDNELINIKKLLLNFDKKLLNIWVEFDNQIKIIIIKYE